MISRLRDAAREASASGAPGSAASYLARALVETELPMVRVELLFELGVAQLQAGLGGATQRMREALELSTDPRRRAEICLALGRGLWSAGDYAAAREALGHGLAELPDETDDLALELRAWYVTFGPQRDWLAFRRDHRGLPAVVATRLRALVADEAPGRTRIERLLLVQLAYGSALSGVQPHYEVARLARRALADGALLDDSATDTGPYGAACHALLFAGEPDAAIAELDRAIELSQRQGSRVAFGQLSLLRGRARYTRGALLDALADSESASNAYGEGYL